jgi:hypothetical protein
MWLLKFYYVQFSSEMSTRCPIGHESENLWPVRARASGGYHCAAPSDVGWARARSDMGQHELGTTRYGSGPFADFATPTLADPFGHRSSWAASWPTRVTWAWSRKLAALNGFSGQCQGSHAGGGAAGRVSVKVAPPPGVCAMVTSPR